MMRGRFGGFGRPHMGFGFGRGFGFGGPHWHHGHYGHHRHHGPHFFHRRPYFMRGHYGCFGPGCLGCFTFLMSGLALISAAIGFIIFML